MEEPVLGYFVLVRNADTGDVSRIPIFMTALQRMQQKFLTYVAYKTDENFYFYPYYTSKQTLAFVNRQRENMTAWISSSRNSSPFSFIVSPDLTGNGSTSAWYARNFLPWRRTMVITFSNTAWNRTRKLSLIKNLLYHR